MNPLPASHRDVANCLYKINFLTARKELPGGEIDRRYFEENRLSAKFSDFGYDWEIHPAYRWALQPDSVADIYQRLELSTDQYICIRFLAPVLILRIGISILATTMASAIRAFPGP